MKWLRDRMRTTAAPTARLPAAPCGRGCLRFPRRGGPRQTGAVLPKARRSPDSTPTLASTVPRARTSAVRDPAGRGDTWRGEGGPHRPQEELYVHHGRRDLLHHVGDEVELVARAGQLVETCAGGENPVPQCDPGTAQNPPRAREEATPPKTPPGSEPLGDPQQQQ